MMDEVEDWDGKVRALVDTFFEDMGTTERWMRAKNPLLGGFSPNEMIQMGRGEKLFKIVAEQLSENKPKENTDV